MKQIKLTNSQGLSLSFLENGNLFSIDFANIMINQVLGNPLEGSLNNIYLRVYEKDKISYAPILGPQAKNEFMHSHDCLVWQGEFQDIKYRCICSLNQTENVWFWDVQVENTGSSAKTIDIVYTQDIGLADKGAVRNNEAYISQYLDHEILCDNDHGYVVCSRQNMPQTMQDGAQVYPWIMQGCLSKTIGYTTDGFQFFGKSYKSTNIPEALLQEQLPSQRLQYEFAFTALQSETITLEPSNDSNIIFYAYYKKDHPEASGAEDLLNLEKITELSKDRVCDLCEETYFISEPRQENLFSNPKMFKSLELTDEDISGYFGDNVRHVEEQQGQKLSFFCEDASHVVLAAKELEVERPHGHILRSGQDVLLNENILCTTAYMYGIFNSQLTIGNTSFNKLLTISRNHLNILKSCGQRIFVKTSAGYELLGLPSAFQIGINFCKWIYKNKDHTIIIKTWTSMDDPACFLDIIVENGNDLEFLISNNIVLGVNEYQSKGKVIIDEEKKQAEFVPALDEMVASLYPENKFYMVSADSDKIEEISYDGENPYVFVKTKPTNNFLLTFTGNILDAKQAEKLAEKYSKQKDDFCESVKQNEAFWNILNNGFDLKLDKLNDIVKWYTHNAMIHYSSPHGLEQYNGAAWGTRDVCQGPMELFLAMRNFEPAREILKIVFSHQFSDEQACSLPDDSEPLVRNRTEKRNWPQWFMFDRFVKIQQHESHGDIIVWPLKALFDYIETTGDFSILEEQVPYTNPKDFSFTDNAKIIDHARDAIQTIIDNFIPGTSLSCYGDGDWDDTLQPADASMRENMVSGWTVSLTYQVFIQAVKVFNKSGHTELAEKLEKICESIKTDYNKYIIKEEVASGFVYFNDLENIDYLLHPNDTKTGLKYRLLPMTRSMISELFTKEQMQKHFDLIKKHLYFPDGVHLMNDTVTYKGGVNKFFKRAEQASNFGREIGLQYVHAHIRFIEAMAKIGNAQEVYKGLLTINPILISETVPCAKTRQSNAYFSSSDADFKDRYEAKQKFMQIKDGKIQVKGGWRIYSSGPGIYINQIISNFLGIRQSFDNIIFDPVISKELDGLEFKFNYNGKPVTYKYHVEKNEHSPYKIVVNGQEITELSYSENSYRKGGVVVARDVFERALVGENDFVDIYT